MACFSPIKGYRSDDGTVKFAKGQDSAMLEVACGQCAGCRLERSRQWAVRCLHEAQMHDRNCFITLTYDDDHLPASRSVDVRDWQLFAKRLRKERGKFRFFHCGEYGDATSRPHYHACVFGMDFAEDRVLYRRTPHKLWTSPALTAIWGKGHSIIGALTFDTAAYVARYIMKKRTGAGSTEHYAYVDQETGERHERRPEYTTMSRRPGLGASWLERYSSDVYPNDFVVTNGRPARPPRYYDDRLELTDPELVEEIKFDRARKAEKHAHNNTPERLAVREKCEEARRSRAQREPQ